MKSRFPTATMCFPSHPNLQQQHLLSTASLNIGKQSPLPKEVQIATPTSTYVTDSAK
jgi:hypothetical protein